MKERVRMQGRGLHEKRDAGRKESGGRVFDIVALGELLVDFTESGRSPEGGRLFLQNPGGAPANLLAAAAKLGCRTAMIGKVGADGQGAFLKEQLEQAGVSAEGIVTDDGVFTTLAFVALDQNGERRFSFARKPGADTCLSTEEVRLDLIENSRIFHFGSLSLTDPPARGATEAAVRFAREKGVIVSFDPNYRAPLWPDGETAAKRMQALVGSADIVKAAEEEIGMLTGESDPLKAAGRLHGAGVSIVAFTFGEKGALVSAGGEKEWVGAFRLPVVDTTGAGDAFFGGFLAAFLQSGRALPQLTAKEAAGFAKVGAAAAALAVGKRGGIPSMPSAAEVGRLMASGGKDG